VHEDFYKFLLDKFPAVMKWKGPNEDPNSVFNKHMANLGSGGAAAPIQIEEIKVEEKKAPAKAGPVAKKAPVKKQPSKVLRGKTWECYDYGEEELVLRKMMSPLDTCSISTVVSKPQLESKVKLNKLHSSLLRNARFISII